MQHLGVLTAVVRVSNLTDLPVVGRRRVGEALRTNEHLGAHGVRVVRAVEIDLQEAVRAATVGVREVLADVGVEALGHDHVEEAITIEIGDRRGNRTSGRRGAERNDGEGAGSVVLEHDVVVLRVVGATTEDVDVTVVVEVAEGNRAAAVGAKVVDDLGQRRADLRRVAHHDRTAADVTIGGLTVDTGHGVFHRVDVAIEVTECDVTNVVGVVAPTLDLADAVRTGSGRNRNVGGEAVEAHGEVVVRDDDRRRTRTRTGHRDERDVGVVDRIVVVVVVRRGEREVAGTEVHLGNRRHIAAGAVEALVGHAVRVRVAVVAIEHRAIEVADHDVHVAVPVHVDGEHGATAATIVRRVTGERS